MAKARKSNVAGKSKRARIVFAFFILAVAVFSAFSPISMLLAQPPASSAPQSDTAMSSSVCTNANGVAGSIFNCNSLFTTGAPCEGTDALVKSSLTHADTFNSMLALGVAIILMVVALMGVVYAIGRAFNISKLVDFARREYVEVLANIIIIVVVLVGGFVIFNNATVFFAYLASAAVGTSVSGSPASINFVTGTSTTAGRSSLHAGGNAIFIDTCTAYETSIINDNLYNYIDVVFYLFLIESEVHFMVNLVPNDFGFTLSPFTGIQTLLTTLWGEEAISFAIISMGALVIMLLFVIYFLFPIFFYVGIVLRCFPWTRAAGGAMLALFISFYIILPALLYTFSQFSNGSTLCAGANSAYVQTNAGTNGQVPPGGEAGNSQAPAAAAYEICGQQSALGTVWSTGQGDFVGFVESFFAVIGGETSFGDVMQANVFEFTGTTSYAVLQMVGLIISFIICYDMLEFLGDILGAPSLQSNKILSKVI